MKILEACQFTDFKLVQTLLPDIETLPSDKQVIEGYGQGAFVVIRALKLA